MYIYLCEVLDCHILQTDGTSQSLMLKRKMSWLSFNLNIGKKIYKCCDCFLLRDYILVVCTDDRILCCLISLICCQRENSIFYFAKYSLQNIANSFLLLLINILDKCMLQSCVILPITL